MINRIAAYCCNDTKPILLLQRPQKQGSNQWTCIFHIVCLTITTTILIIFCLLIWNSSLLTQYWSRFQRKSLLVNINARFQPMHLHLHIFHIISRPGGINISEKWKEKKHFSRTLPAIWLITIFLLTDFHPDIGKNQSISRIAELRSLKSWRGADFPDSASWQSKIFGNLSSSWSSLHSYSYS